MGDLEEDPEDDEDGKNDIVILVPHLLHYQHEGLHHGDQHHEDQKRNVDLLHEGLKRSVDHDDDDDGAWVMHDNNTPREDDDMDDDEIVEVDVDSMAIDEHGILLAEKKKMVVQHDDNMTKRSCSYDCSRYVAGTLLDG